MITNLSAQNFKDQTFSDELAKVTLYTGKNSAGKSARLEALALATLGYVPGFSKKPSDLFSLFSTGQAMAVACDNDDGTTARQWSQERGSVKYTGPEEPCLPPVLLDPAAYFELSGPERQKFLFAASGAAKNLDAKKLAETVTANLKNIKVEENTQATEAVVGELVAWLGQRQKCGPQEWVENLLADAKDKIKLAKQNVARLEKTAQGNAQAAATDQPAPADAEERLEQARQALAMNEAVVTRLETELNTARREYNEAKALAESAVDEGAARARMAELSVEKERLFRATQEVPSDKAEFAAWQEAEDGVAESSLGLATVLSELDRLKAELEHAQSEKTCPTCGQSTVEIKKRLVAELKKELKLAEAAVKVAQTGHKAIRANAEAKAKACNLQRAAVEQYQEDSKAFRRLSEEHAMIQAKLAGGERAAEAAAKLPAMQAAGVELKQRHADAVAVAAARRDDVSKWDVQAKRLTAERADAAQRARVTEECAKARAEAAVIKEFVGFLTDLQAGLVEQAVGPLVARMNELCAPVLPHPVAFRDGELLFGGHSHRTASDSEKLLIYAAMSVALAADSPLKLCAIGRLESFDGGKKVTLVKLLVDLIAAGKLTQAVLVEVDSGNVGARWWAQAEGEDFKVVRL